MPHTQCRSTDQVSTGSSTKAAQTPNATSSVPSCQRAANRSPSSTTTSRCSCGHERFNRPRAAGKAATATSSDSPIRTLPATARSRSRADAAAPSARMRWA
ncbi:hypothetical protein G6F46_014393 [Rhizopus delemar]|nr:hypothetical protein G6F46_014393 [Rhizopus delemar]